MIDPVAAMNNVIRSHVADLSHATVCDLGACNGATALQLLGWLPDAPKKFLVVECDPRNLRLIEDAKLPECMEVIPVAVGREDGKATLHLSSSKTHKGPGGMWSVSSTLLPPKDTRTVFPFIDYESDVVVPVRSLDSLCAERGIEYFDFLWVDIEGSERAMIEGGRRVLERSRFMFIEAWRMELYEGMWTRDEMLRQLPGWEVLGEWEADMLLRNARA